jgi:hypothetical protein
MTTIRRTHKARVRAPTTIPRIAGVESLMLYFTLMTLLATLAFLA